LCVFKAFNLPGIRAPGSAIHSLNRIHSSTEREKTMCFSPEASFAGSIIIGSIGIATVRKVHKPSQLVFACIPLFFAVQQLAEGFLWIALPDAGHYYLQKISTYIFLGMADVIWPMMIPLSVLLMEENPKKKKIIQVFLVSGLAL
jgi:hypothetical protein